MRRAWRSIQGLVAVLLLIMVGACTVDPPATPVKPIIGKLGAEAETRRVVGALTGQFLVATPRMEDPRFARTVIFMISHDEKGAMGLVVNRAFGQGSLSQLLTGFGVTEYRRSESTVRLFYGGPVEPERGFVLHSGDYKGISTRRIDEHVSVSTGKDVLEAIAAGNGPAEAMFIIGYAGWSAGQLEREMARDDWLTAPGDPHLIFSEHPERTWGEVYREAGLVL